MRLAMVAGMVTALLILAGCSDGGGDGATGGPTRGAGAQFAMSGETGGGPAFGAPIRIDLPATPVSLETTTYNGGPIDFNRDQLPDIFALQESATPGALVTNTGFGSFTVRAVAAPVSYGLRLGDIDGNGTLDYVCCEDSRSFKVVRRNSDSGYSVIEYVFPGLPRGNGETYTSSSFEMLDVNGDRAPDLIFLMKYSIDGYEYPGGLVAYLNDGQGNFRRGPYLRLSDAELNSRVQFAVSSADVDGDGLSDDLVFIDQRYSEDNYWKSLRVVVFRNIGGSFTLWDTVTWRSMSASWALQLTLTIADFDGAPGVDIAIADSAGVGGIIEQRLVILSNQGDGHFSVRSANLLPLSILEDICHGDFDRDGDNDLAMTHSYGGPRTLVIMENLGGAVFRQANSYTYAGVRWTGDVGGIVDVLDYNRDGILDLAVLSNGAGYGKAIYIFPGLPAQ